MVVKDVIDFLENYAPLKYAEDFDNVGLLTGDLKEKVTGILICLDSTKEVVQEAIDLDYNLVISFHPIIFNGLKKLDPGNYVNDSIILAIKNNISIFAIHTALDNSKVGVNMKLCEVLGISDCKILLAMTPILLFLIIFWYSNIWFAPDFLLYDSSLKKILFDVGAGSIGKYDNCSFSVDGTGSFKGNEKSNPTVGQKLKYVEQDEVCISITYLSHFEERVLSSLREVHPYEEIAYEIITLENINENIGMGMLGVFNKSLSEKELFDLLKKKLGTKFLKHSKLLHKPIKKIAVLGGSGSFAIHNAISKKVDAFLTADLKYHDYFKAENKILLVDIGHYESEQYTKNILFDILRKKFPNFAIVLANTNTNPVNYT